MTDRRGHQLLERLTLQMQIGAASVGFGSSPPDQTGLGQNAQVMGYQVRRHRQLSLQLRGRCVGDQQLINNCHPIWIGQGGVNLGAPRRVDEIRLTIHWLNGH